MGIGVVIVTYNRKKELERALELFDRQTRLPAYIIVVDNASTDGTGETLKQWSQKESQYRRIVVCMESNQGGSGGFYEGFRRGLELEAEWLWVSDDDAFPETDALYQAERFLESYKNQWDKISAICGEVINQGKIDTKHRKRYYPKGLKIVEECVSEEEYKKEGFLLNTFSYVGSIVNRQKLSQVGLTNKDYFIWWDDTEHSLRLSKVGKIICIPAIKIHHDVQESSLALNWKTYYGFRNMCDMYKRHMPLICYVYFCLKIIIKIWISKWKKEEMKVLAAAYQDVRHRKFGLHPVYHPGWKPGEKGAVLEQSKQV